MREKVSSKRGSGSLKKEKKKLLKQHFINYVTQTSLTLKLKPCKNYLQTRLTHLYHLKQNMLTNTTNSQHCFGSSNRSFSSRVKKKKSALDADIPV